MISKTGLEKQPLVSRHVLLLQRTQAVNISDIFMAASSDNPVYSTRPVLTSPNGAFPVTAHITNHLFSHPQSPDALETRVRQLHDRRNSRTAIRRHHVWVQHRGGQHGEETARGLFSPGPQPNPLHHHLLSKVLYTRFTSLQCTYIFSFSAIFEDHL